MEDGQEPIGASSFPPIVAEHRIHAGYSFDVVAVVETHVDRHPGVELVSLTPRSRWFGLRQDVRLAVRGSEWDIARFWDDVVEDLPRQRDWGLLDPFSWWS